jgi:hypothetical protein
MSEWASQQTVHVGVDDAIADLRFTICENVPQFCLSVKTSHP